MEIIRGSVIVGVKCVNIVAPKQYFCLLQETSYEAIYPLPDIDRSVDRVRPTSRSRPYTVTLSDRNPLPGCGTPWAFHWHAGICGD
jgi:hypothetical protein